MVSARRRRWTDPAMMNDQPNRAGMRYPPSNGAPTKHTLSALPMFPKRWLRVDCWLPLLIAAMVWFVLVYFLPLHTLRKSRLTARTELTHLLQTDKPSTPAILEAFDRATEQVLFSAAGPYFILGIATLFVISHLVAVKRRLNTAERNIQTLRDVVLGVDGVPRR